ncbi:DUF4168 domain-containing protein [Umezakia ovalisporum]|uniref:DUF4168 domain-containing protein n=1 Tax=Umezakia ovalisporum TaxID=75695 RepID=UPI002473CE17|nr:DUF4168 domain-containing protein [Umezakia ovalisporum]MDH6088534.1 DUF4168 domain-containing protein [Umezakia ovalisporum Ak1311]
MLKQLLKGSSVLVLLLASNVSALAEAPKSKLQIHAQFQQPQAQSVSPEELQQFASLIPALQEIGQTAQQRTTQALEQSGISLERFQELSQAQDSPEPQLSSPPTPEEQKSFNQVKSQIQLIQEETLSQHEQVVRSVGLEPNRFNEIFGAIQQEEALQQQLRQILQNN